MMKHNLDDIREEYQNPDNWMDGCCPVCESEDISLEKTDSQTGWQYKCNNPECEATFL